MKREKPRKPYEKPAVEQLTTEEAKRKLLEYARRGDRGAKEMLEMVFPEVAKNLSKDKKSA